MKRTHHIGDSMVVHPVTVSPDVGIVDAHEIMRGWGMRHLPVVVGDDIVGVLSERDIYRTISIKGNNKISVREAMSESPYIVSSGSTLKEVVNEMAKNKYGCVLVRGSKGGVRGIFTRTDALYVLCQLLSDPEDNFRIMNIEDYLTHHQKLAI